MHEKLTQAIERDELRKVLSQTAYYYFGEKMAKDKVSERIEALNANSDTPLEEKELNEIVDKAKESRKKKTIKNDNITYTSFLETPEYILEQIRNADDADLADDTTYTKFIKYDKATKLTEILDSVMVGEREFRPIIDNLLTSGVVLLPTGVEEYGDDTKLAKTIRDFLYQYFEVPEFFANFLPYLAMFYWVYDQFPVVPYLHFVGLTGTGKSTAQEVFGSICYKPINASGSITMSPIFRTASTWRGTLLLDEFEPDGDSYKEMISFLKSGFGNTAILRTEGDSKREVIAYMIKSPKIFTSENPINNAGLQSRTIVIKMEKNKRRIPLYRLKKFLGDAEHIRNKLLLWRFRHMTEINLDEIEFGFPELQGFDARVQQVLTPVYYLSNEENRASICEFAEIQEAETKRERLDSIDGQVFFKVAEAYPGQVSLKQICEDINSDRASRPVTEKRVGAIVRKILGLNIEQVGHEKARMVVVEDKEDRINELKLYFGVSSSQPSASSATSANGQSEHTDNIEIADDSLTEMQESEDISEIETTT